MNLHKIVFTFYILTKIVSLNFTEKLEIYVNNILKNYSDNYVYENYFNNTLCQESYKKSFYSLYYYKLFYYSGKNFSEFGDYTECLYNDFSYFFIWLKNLTSKNINPINSIDDDIYMGICLPPNCEEFHEKLFNNNNTKFIRQIFGEMNITNTFSVNNETQRKNQANALKIPTKFILFMILIYFLLRLIVTLLGYLYYERKDFAQYESYHKYNSEMSINMLSDRHGTKSQKVKKVGYKIYKLLSIMNSYRYLNTLKNNIYDDEDLENFCLYKVLSIFGITFYSIFFLSYKTILSRNISFNMFLDSPLFLFAKLSSYCFSLYLFVSGVTLSYKLLMFMMKRKNTDFITFFKFFSNCLNKLFILFALTFFYIYCSFDVYNYIGDYYLVKDRNIGLLNIEKNYVCFDKPHTIFIPFYLNYYSKHGAKYGSNTCYKEFLLISSEFYLFIFSLILFYLIYKVKSRKFEILILVLIFTPLIFVINTRTDVDKKNFDYFFDHSQHLRPHLAIFHYFIGIIIGVNYYLHKNIQMIDNETFYIPFNFFIELNRYFMKKSYLSKRIFKYFIIILILVLASAFYQLKNLKTSSISYFLYFEKNIFTILIALFSFINIHLEEYNKWKIPYIIYLSVARCGLTYIMSLEFLIGIIHLKQVMEYNLSYMKLFSTSTSTFVFILIFSSMISILFEIPFRVLRKKTLK